jgi:hypothetical protein
MDQGHRRWILCHLAMPHNRSSSKASPQVPSHRQRPPAPRVPRQTINQTYNSSHCPRQHSSAQRTQREHSLGLYMEAVEITGNIYSNQTGRFPTTSGHGNKCIMIVSDYDSNAILAEPLKSRNENNENELLRACTKLHALLVTCGLKPVLDILDNEAPGKLKLFMRANQRLPFNWSLPTSIVIMPLRAPSPHSKITSLPLSAQPIRSFPCIFGAVSSTKPPHMSRVCCHQGN